MSDAATESPTSETQPSFEDRVDALRERIDELERQIQELERTRAEAVAKASVNGWRAGEQSVIRQLRALHINVNLTEPSPPR